MSYDLVEYIVDYRKEIIHLPLVLVSSSLFDVNDNTLVLSQAEISEVENLSQKSRNRYLLGRICSNLSYFIQSPENFTKIEILKGAFGDPVFFNKNFNTSISHTVDKTAALTYNRLCTVGIDIEAMNKDYVLALESMTGPEELSSVSVIMGRLSALTMFWTIKEALSKAIKCGLTIPIQFLKTKNVIIKSSNHVCCEFEYFPQYKGIGLILEDLVVSVAFPFNMNLIDYCYHKNLKLPKGIL